MIRLVYRRVRSIIKRISRSLKKIVPIYIPVYKSNLLKDRCAFITGGTRGIGYEIAKSFLLSGANVVITGRSQEGVDKAVNNLISTGDFTGKVYGLVMDNSDIKSFETNFQNAVEWTKKIDILVNNAGVIQGGNFGSFEEIGFMNTFDINLKGSAFLSEIVAKYYIKNRIQGNILNICSSSSLRPAVSAYTMSKWGLRGLTLGMAKALISYGIVVNGIAPGPTSTELLIKDGYDGIENDLNPSGRYASAVEIANMATILVSSMGRMIVGDVIYMTGGAGVITYDDMDYRFI